MSERISSQQYRARAAKPKRSKYKAERTLVDGIMFASKAEGRFHSELALRARAGEVTDVDRQVRYSFVINGVHVADYVLDFRFYDRLAGRYRLIDVKGVETPAFKLKRKLMKACHGLEVEVCK